MGATASMGSLVVSLEANVAKFTADMEKSSKLTVDSMAKMAKSSEAAQKAMKSLESQAASAKAAAISLGKGLLLGAAVGMSIDGIKNKILGVIATMATLKTISEKTGASVENLSKLAFISKQAGSDIDGVAAALAKMSKGMAGADNETKGAGLALNYLGLSAKDAAGNLKDPAVMFMDVAKKLGQYEDGAGKAAIAQALFGKSGADMLPTLKLLAEQGDMAAKVTTEQATAARQYQRDLARLEAQKGLLFKTIATALLPSMTDFANALLDASKNTNQANRAIKGLTEDNSITEWGDSAAMGLARLVDVIVMIPKALSAVTSSFKVVGADIVVLGKAAAMARPEMVASAIAQGRNPWKELKDSVAERNKVLADANAKYDTLWNYDGAATEKAMEKRIAARGKGGAAAVVPLKKLNYDSSGEDGKAQAAADKAAKEAARTAKNASDGKLKSIEEGLAQEQNALEFGNKYVAELRSQDLISLQTYESYRAMAIESARDIAVAAYDKEIAVAQKYHDSLSKGSEREAAQTRLTELQAKKQLTIQNALQETTLHTLGLSAAQSELNKTAKEWVVQQDQAASQFQFEISMMGKSALECAKLTAARRIYLDIESRIQQAQKNSAGPIDRSAFDRERDAAIAASNKLYDQSDAKQRDPWFNMQESVRKYGEEADNVGKMIGDSMTNAFQGAEDAFVSFVTTGKLSFSSLATSILSDIAKIQARKAIAGLVNYAVGAMDGMFGPGDVGGPSLAGARANGGPVSSGLSYLVGERGPEIFTPSNSGSITPNHAISGGGGGITINTNVSVSSGNASSKTSGDSSNTGRALSDMVVTVVKDVLVRETRQGGILWNR